MTPATTPASVGIGCCQDRSNLGFEVTQKRIQVRVCRRYLRKVDRAPVEKDQATQAAGLGGPFTPGPSHSLELVTLATKRFGATTTSSRGPPEARRTVP